MRAGLLWQSGLLVLTLGCESAPPPAVPEADAFDLPAIVSSTQARGGIGTALLHSRILTTALIVPGQTVDPAVSIGDIGDALAAQAGKLSGGCGGVKVTHVPGTNAVAISLPVSKCAIGDVSVAGFIDIKVVNKDKVVTIALTLTAVKIRGHQFDGTLALTTSDGKVFDTALSLQFDTLVWAWSGSQVLDTNGLGATFTGSGSVKKADGDSLAIAIDGLHHNFAACYANAGSVSQTLQVPLTAPKVKAGKLLTTTAKFVFDADSPRDGTVDLVVTVGALKPATQKDLTLPKYGDCPDGTAP